MQFSKTVIDLADRFYWNLIGEELADVLSPHNFNVDTQSRPANSWAA